MAWAKSAGNRDTGSTAPLTLRANKKEQFSSILLSIPVSSAVWGICRTGMV